MRSGPVLASALMFFVSACAQIPDSYGAPSQGLQEVLPDGGPPVVNGLYELWHPACSEDCQDGRALRPLELRALPQPDATVVATTDAFEWLSMVGELYRMRPLRGVVPQSTTLRFYDGTTRDFKAGDIVYKIDDRVYDDWPYEVLWSGGAPFSQTVPGFEQGDEVSLRPDWDIPSDEVMAAQKKADEAAGAGWWALVQRDNGQRGYVLQTALDCWWPSSKDLPSYCQGGRKGQRPSSPLN